LRGENVIADGHAEEILTELRRELDLVKTAIVNLQKLGREGQRERLRPPDLVVKSNPDQTVTTSS
jgi:hypothetical protein